MPREPKHLPIITGDRAGCSCGRWPVLSRGEDETPGHFIPMAYAAHKEHAANPHAQPALFDMQTLTPIFGDSL